MGVTDRVRSLAGRAGRALTSFSASAPAVEGFEPRSQDRADRDPKITSRLRSQEALFGRTTYGAGPSPTRYSSYPGTGLEPTAIWNLQVLRNNGYPQQWVELCEQVIERDGHLGGIIDTRRQSVADKPFRIHPARRSDDLAEVIANLTERIVDGIDGFDQSVEDLLSASAYGYALSEIVWDRSRVRVPTLGSGSATVELVVPRSLNWVHWKHVRFDRNTDEPYLWLGQGGEFSIPPNKFIFHDGAGTGLIERRGFMGSCVWLSAAKRWSERDWLVYAKLFGIPNIIAKYPDSQEEYEAHRSEYVKFLKDWGEGVPALLPDSLVTEITREPAGRSGDIHGSIIGWANSEMSKRILGSTLTVEMGGQGSWAAADTHRDAPYMRSRSDSRKLDGTLRRDLFKPIVWVNCHALAGVIGKSPEELMDCVAKCSRRIEREMTPVDRQRVYEGAVNELGLEVDEDQYRDEMGMDAPRASGPKLRGKPLPIGPGGLAPSVDASKDGVEAPKKEPAQPARPPQRPSDSVVQPPGGNPGRKDNADGSR